MDAKYFGKCKASELRAELEQARKKSKPQQRVKIVLKKIISNMILNRSEMAMLMTDVIDLMVIDDYEIRRLCCHFIVHYSEVNTKDTFSSLDFFARFVHDMDPMLRALAIKTLTSISSPQFCSLAFKCIKTLLSDKNPYVRTSAAFSVGRLYQHDPKTTVEFGLIEALNELLYDDDHTVSGNALAALDSITESSSSLNLNINKEHSLELMRQIGLQDEWRQVYLLNAVMAFVPQTTQDALEVLDTVVPCLSHENSAVVLNGVKVILYLSNYIEPHKLASPALPKRIGSVLVALLTKPPEIQFLVLRNVILLLLGKSFLISVDVESFFWKFDDPIYIKDTKLEILYLLANEDNIDAVFRELEEYATEVDPKMARKAIRAFGNLSIKSPAAARRCVEILSDLISNTIPYVVQEAAIVVKNILRKHPGECDSILNSICRHYKMMDDADAKLALTWMTGQYAERIANCEEILAYLTGTFSEDPLEVQYATITSVVKYYVKFPQKGESLVLRVLKWATEETDNPDLRDRGYFYWRLITNNQNEGDSNGFQQRTKEIVITVNPEINSDNDKIDPHILEELELSVGSLASIYLKSVRHVFRLAKEKSLISSPALQPRRKSELSYYTNKATNQPIERPFKNDYSNKPLPSIDRNRSTSSFGTNTSLNSSDRGRKESLSQKLSRKASVITRKKNTKF